MESIQENMSAPPLYTNRLIHQKSPYLLQHAHNPVDWYPWSEEAFDRAQREDKPIFLSIGYATCHWCHVMEKESFEDLEVARLLNQTFVNIKVDREELPEVDHLYMEFAQSLMSGSAGWPLNLVLTPHLEPFFAVTYLPPKSNYGMMGMVELIERISKMWEGEERQVVAEQAEKIVDLFATHIHVKGENLPDVEEIQEAVDKLFKLADPIYGGLKGAPKFPIGYQLSFLLRHYKKSQDGRSLFLVEKTLDMMQRGGIFDHLGGGFSRYSIDEEWLVPHFEKMLYDNALIGQVYVEAWQLTHTPFYQQTACSIFDYILQEMTHVDGGFYSAQDADSEGHEGLFYTWSFEELEKLLRPQEEFSLFCQFYGVTEEGNFQGRNILHTSLPLSIFATQQQRSTEDLLALFQKQKAILFQERTKRIPPLKDDKILSSWNGLMIHTLALAGKAFERQDYLQAALKAASFIEQNLWVQGRLFRRWREGETQFPASLDEYAAMIRACLTLFELGCGTRWLSWALHMEEILRLFYKGEEGGFYQTDGKDPYLLIRKCIFTDGAEPSGNALHTENLLRFYQITEQEEFLEQAEDVLKAVADALQAHSTGYTYHLMNLQYYYDVRSPTLIIAAKNPEAWLKKEIFSRFIPHRTLIWQNNDPTLLALLPQLQHHTCQGNLSTLYICRDKTCSAPLIDRTVIEHALDGL